MATTINDTQPVAPEDVDPELGFDPESPDVSDPAVDPLHPALTDNEQEEKNNNADDVE